MCAGGTKVEFGCEMASRGDLAGRRLGVEAWEAVRPADLARREVRLRVGAMVGSGVWGRWELWWPCRNTVFCSGEFL
jgi:hypothetical protein